jgi:hypothetical protein
MDTYPPAKQRAALLKLMSALGCREAALRRDECGDGRIEGSNGHVYAVPGTLDRPKHSGFAIYVITETARAWTYAQRALFFAKVIQDGDTEGGLFLDRLPTKDESGLIRRYCGIPKRVEYSETTLTAKREQFAKVAKATKVAQAVSITA